MYRPRDDSYGPYHGTRFTKTVVNGHKIIKRTPNAPYRRSTPKIKRLSELLPSKTLDEQKLDALSITELEQLKGLIEEQQEKKRHEFYYTAYQPTAAKPYVLTKYRPTEMGLRDYTGEARDPKVRCRDKITRFHEKIFLSEEELLQTTLIFKYRLYMDSLSRQQNQELVGQRIFSLNNSPSLAYTLATIEEACIYMKYHYIHNLPPNPYDLFSYTATVMKFSLYTKLNLCKLSCIMSDYGIGEDEYTQFRQLCGKPTTEVRTRYATEEIQRLHPSAFRQPIHQAMAIVIHIARCAKKLKDYAMKTNEAQFLRDFDDIEICKYYQCGMITRLIIDQLRAHQCDDFGCQNRIHHSMHTWKSSLFFCVYPDTKSPQLCTQIEMPSDVGYICTDNIETCHDQPPRKPSGQDGAHLSLAKTAEKQHNKHSEDGTRHDFPPPEAKGEPSSPTPKKSPRKKSPCRSPAHHDSYDKLSEGEESDHAMELDFDEVCATDSFSDDSE